MGVCCDQQLGLNVLSFAHVHWAHKHTATCCAANALLHAAEDFSSSSQAPSVQGGLCDSQEDLHVLRCVLLLQVLPNKGAGPRALYVALGGQLPVSSTVGSAAPPMP